MWLIIVAAIDNRTHCIDFLDHSTAESLTKCRTRKLCLMPGINSMHNAISLIWKIDSCPASEIESTLCFQEILNAHLCTNLHHGIVTGVCDYFRKGFHSVSVNICTFDGGHISWHTKILVTITIEGITGGYFPLFQSSCHNNGLHNGTRFVNVGYTKVIPHGA